MVPATARRAARGDQRMGARPVYFICMQPAFGEKRDERERTERCPAMEPSCEPLTRLLAMFAEPTI